MRYALFLLCLAPLLFGCNSYEQENNRLKEEIKMLREENNYAKAEIIGLKKELAELSARVKDEREASRRELDEEHDLMQKKVEETRETMQKKAEADKKKGMAAAKLGAQKARDGKKPTGESPGEE
jgi:altronate dehydratase